MCTLGESYTGQAALAAAFAVPGKSGAIVMWIQIFQTGVVLLSLVILIWSMAYHDIPKSRYYLFLAMAIFLYAMGYLLELGSTNLEAAYLAERVQYFGIAFYAIFFFLFIRDYNNRSISNPWALVALFLYPALVLVMVNTYPYIDWYFKDVYMIADPVPRLVAERGIGFYLHIILNYTLILLSAVEVLLHYPSTNTAQRRMRIVFLLATLVPNIAIIILTVEGHAIPMDFASAALTISLLLLGIYILRYRAVDWLPFARDKIMQQMSDGYILLSTSCCFLDANPAAISFFPALEKAHPGTSLSKLPGLPDTLTKIAGYSRDVTVDIDGEQHVLRISPSPVTKEDKLLCYSLLLYDVTEPHRLMAKLEENASHDGLTGLLSRLY